MGVSEQSDVRYAQFIASQIITLLQLLFQHTELFITALFLLLEFGLPVRRTAEVLNNEA